MPLLVAYGINLIKCPDVANLFAAICSGGQYFEESAGQCIECLQGSFKPDADRFGNCKMCPDSFTTDVTNSAKKMSEVDCYIRKSLVCFNILKDFRNTTLCFLHIFQSECYI